MSTPGAARTRRLALLALLPADERVRQWLPNTRSSRFRSRSPWGAGRSRSRQTSRFSSWIRVTTPRRPSAISGRPRTATAGPCRSRPSESGAFRVGVDGQGRAGELPAGDYPGTGSTLGAADPAGLFYGPPDPEPADARERRHGGSGFVVWASRRSRLMTLQDSPIAACTSTSRGTSFRRSSSSTTSTFWRATRSIASTGI